MMRLPGLLLIIFGGRDRRVFPWLLLSVLTPSGIHPSSPKLNSFKSVMAGCYSIDININKSHNLSVSYSHPLTLQLMEYWLQVSLSILLATLLLLIISFNAFSPNSNSKNKQTFLILLLFLEENSLDSRKKGRTILITGPTKSGKTLLYQKVKLRHYFLFIKLHIFSWLVLLSCSLPSIPLNQTAQSFLTTGNY